MRIIAGQFRGRTLQAPAGRTTRPTADRTREAIFNILEHAPFSAGFERARVIDLFAGSGAMGFEALSRGAAFALFVETDAAARGAIRANIETLALFGRARVHRRDAADLGHRPAGLDAAFDIAFLDPPYASGQAPGGLAAQALARLREGDWIAPDGLVVLECAAGHRPSHPGYALLDVREYGAAQALFLRQG